MSVDHLHDFNDPSHRIASASALLQKGIYHLFVLRTDADVDAFASVLRMYQTAYLLCSALLLLDDSFDLNRKAGQLRGPLRGRCSDRRSPSRGEIDPAAVITHSVFESQEWKGFADGHPLHLGSDSALRLFARIVEARHNLIYRPFLLANAAGRYWEDCQLLDRIREMATPQNVEMSYQAVGAAIVAEDLRQKAERQRRVEYLRSGAISLSESGSLPRLWAIELLQEMHMEYRDVRDNRPTETILLTYARMLHGDDTAFLGDLGRYENELLTIQGESGRAAQHAMEPTARESPS